MLKGTLPRYLTPAIAAVFPRNKCETRPDRSRDSSKWCCDSRYHCGLPRRTGRIADLAARAINVTIRDMLRLLQDWQKCKCRREAKAAYCRPCSSFANIGRDDGPPSPFGGRRGGLCLNHFVQANERGRIVKIYPTIANATCIGFWFNVLQAGFTKTRTYSDCQCAACGCASSPTVFWPCSG